MNLILIEQRELNTESEVCLYGRRATHLRQVLGVDVGRALRVGVLGVGQGEGVVLRVDESEVVLSVRVDAPLEPVPPVDLVLALPRPPTLKKVLQQATALGVGQIHLVRANRVEKSYFMSPLLEPARLRDELLLGLEQGRGVRLPEVHIHTRFLPFVEDHLPGLLANQALGLLAEPGEHPDLLQLKLHEGRASRVVVAVGPEGGWTPHELEQLQGAGLLPVSMGARPLRVETAVVALLAQVMLCLGHAP